MLNRMLGRSAIALLAAFSFSAESGAASEVHHASLCNPKAGSASFVAYSIFGMHNKSTTQTASISCGGILNQESRSIGVAARVYDRHATQDVCCTAVWENPDTGDTLASGSKCSSGFSSAQTTLIINIPTTTVTLAYVECTIPPASINGFSHLEDWVAN